MVYPAAVVGLRKGSGALRWGRYGMVRAKKSSTRLEHEDKTSLVCIIAPLNAFRYSTCCRTITDVINKVSAECRVAPGTCGIIPDAYFTVEKSSCLLFFVYFLTTHDEKSSIFAIFTYVFFTRSTAGYFQVANLPVCSMFHTWHMLCIKSEWLTLTHVTPSS